MIRSPVLIIGCPRSGTTLLFNILSEEPSLWSIGYESKAIIEKYHHPALKGWESGALESADLTPQSKQYILAEFERQAAPGTFWRRIDHVRTWLRSNYLWRQIKQRGRTAELGSGVSSALPQRGLDSIRSLVRVRNTLLPHRSDVSIRLVEKTPENCLRLPFLLAIFPDARVLYLTRDGRSNINSLIEGWQQPHLFPGYQVPEQLTIPGYTRGRWAFTLIPGWRELAASPLEEVCAWQWVRCNEAVLAHRDASHIPYLTVRYEDLIAQPARELHRVAAFLDLDYDKHLARFGRGLPRINVVSAPDRDKWRQQNAAAVERTLPLIEPMMERLGYKL